MKKVIVLLITTLFVFGGISHAQGFTADISKEDFKLDVNKFFPSFGTTEKISDSSGEGVNNFTALIESMIPMLTTIMAVGATLMLILGGFRMVIGGASSEHTEAGKSIIKDAVIGLTLGLLAYVIISFVGSILNV